MPIPAEPRKITAQEDIRRLPRLFWIYWLVVLLSVSVEWSVVFWSPEYLEQVVGLDRVTAAGALTFFFLATVIGRFAGSRLTRHIRPGILLTSAAVVVVAAFPVFWLARSPALAVAALFTMGLGIANLFPLTLAAGTTVAAGTANLASARISLAAGLAILVAPQVLGSLAEHTGIEAAFLLAGVGAAAVLILTASAAVAQRRSDRRLAA